MARIEIDREWVVGGAKKAVRVALGLEGLAPDQTAMNPETFRAGLLGRRDEVGQPGIPPQAREETTSGPEISPAALAREEEEEKISFPPENLTGESDGGVPRDPEIDRLDQLSDEEMGVIFKPEDLTSDGEEEVSRAETIKPQPSQEEETAPSRPKKEKGPGLSRRITGGLRAVWQARKKTVRPEETSIAGRIDRGFGNADRFLSVEREVAVPMNGGKSVVFVRVGSGEVRRIEDVLAVLQSEGISCAISPRAGGLMRLDGREMRFFNGRELGKIKAVLERGAAV